MDFKSNNVSKLIKNPVTIKHNKIVVLGIGNPNAEINKISKKLKQLNFEVIWPTEVMQFFNKNKIEFENYWLTSDLDLYRLNKKYIYRTYNLFKDKKSQSLFKEIIDFRTNSIQHFSPEPDKQSLRYLPLDLPWIKKSTLSHVVDCGAYNGDTLSSFIKKGYKIGTYYAFEPNKIIFNELIKKSFEYKKINIQPLKMATWSSTTLINLMAADSKLGNSFLDKNSKTQANVIAVKLDDIFKNLDVNLVKMDIEGAELETLKGLRNKIRKSTPHLAISVYHKPDDLWRIPLYINTINRNYNFYLRVYGNQSFDTVLYCVPK